MKIYTKTGDKGQTGLIGNERVPKNHPRIAAYGAADELNSAIGIALCVESLSTESRAKLTRIQNELFALGSELASRNPAALKITMLGPTHIERLESEMDQMEKALKPLKNFILPGGTPQGAQLHFARALSRRFEREVVALSAAESIRPGVIQYINRLADFLFMIARFENRKVEEIIWSAP